MAKNSASAFEQCLFFVGTGITVAAAWAAWAPLGMFLLGAFLIAWACASYSERTSKGADKC